MPLQKNMIIVDANVILRYLLKDNEKFYKEAEALFNEAFSGKKKNFDNAFCYCGSSLCFKTL
jgi:predicted nucleic-acid-binding protein